ncbi:hypothetical protein [Lacipirellula parvula]|nr:hypothetical protein [Lacipirellula parvula]
MQQVSQRLRLAHLLILSSALAGCGPAGPTKYPVQGQVTFKGEPIVKGTMTLIPDSPAGRTATAPIADGKYSAELTEGSWTVNVQAVRETGPVIPALGEAPREQFIPAKYNRESTLKISVPSDEPEHNFALEP